MRVLQMLKASRNASHFADRIEYAIFAHARGIARRVLRVVFNKRIDIPYSTKVLTFADSADYFVETP